MQLHRAMSSRSRRTDGGRSPAAVMRFGFLDLASALILRKPITPADDLEPHTTSPESFGLQAQKRAQQPEDALHLGRPAAASYRRRMRRASGDAMPTSGARSTTRRTAATPARWPATRGKPRRVAQRPLPSMMMATCNPSRGSSASFLLYRALLYAGSWRPLASTCSAAPFREESCTSRFCE